MWIIIFLILTFLSRNICLAAGPTCNPKSCDTKVGCIMNRCGTKTASLNCNACGYIAGGDNNYCGMCGKTVVIIPGYGSSWNTQAMLFDSKIADNEWKIPKYAYQFYEKLEKGIRNSVDNSTRVWFWNYDWRLPIKDISGKLDIFLKQKTNKGEKIVLIGHSLGGLVARVWGQDNYRDQRLEKIISIGSPQMGAISAYDAWGFGKVGDGNDWGSIALNIFVELKRKNGQSRSDTIRQVVPMVRDLLPVFDYAKIAGTMRSYKDMETVNTYIDDKNRSINLISGKLVNIVGTGENTKEVIDLATIGIGSYLYGKGDGTVLEKSAGFGGKVRNIISKHVMIPEKSLEMILEELGIRSIKQSSMSISINVPSYKNKVVIFGDPKIKYSLECNNNIKIQSDEFGFVSLDEGSVSSCNVVAKANVNTNWAVVSGKSSDVDSWKKEEIKVEQNKPINILIDSNILKNKASENTGYTIGSNGTKIEVMPQIQR